MPASAQQEINQGEARSPSVTKKELKTLARRSELFFALGMVLFVAVLFVLGRLYWDERYYIPEEGLGYALGLIGGIMMLIAYGYAAVKHIGWLRRSGIIRHWLRIHIFFGIFGPILVILHSTFRFGSLNGAIALVSMVLVFLSGVMGRYLYSKIHYGLGGQKARVGEVKENLISVGKRIQSKRLERFTASVMSHPGGLFSAWFDLVLFGWKSRWLSFQLRRDMKRHLQVLGEKNQWTRKEIRRHRREFRRQLSFYMLMLRKVSLFSVYERFFAFWRHAHVPLLYLLFLSGVVHVIAVHMY
jgi:hypothetical protein